MKALLRGALALTAAATLMLTGCSSTAQDEQEQDTLAGTKPQVQLLRNRVAGDVDENATGGVTKVEDASVACNDPDGLIRMWRSTALLELMPDAAPNVATIARDLGDSLAEHGWASAETAVSGSALTLELENPASPSLIRITANEDADGDGRGATIFVVVTGPCVETDGPGSDELAALGE